MKIAAGWQMKDRLDTCGVVLQQRTATTGGSWILLDPNNPAGTRDVFPYSGFNGKVNYDAATGRLFSSSISKLYALSLRSRKEELLLELTEEEGIGREVWVDPLHPSRILFVTHGFSPSKKKGREIAKQRPPDQGSGVTFSYDDYRLKSFDSDDKRVRELCRFPKDLYSCPTLIGNRFYAAAQPDVILALDLSTGEMRYREGQGIRGLTVSHDGELFGWSRAGISRIDFEGEDQIIWSTGEYPSFSKTGAVAFREEENTLWFAQKGDELTCLISYDEPVNQSPTADMAWCPCGKHLAAGLTNHRSQAFTVVADVERKELMTYSHLGSRAHLGAIWLERGALA